MGDFLTRWICRIIESEAQAAMTHRIILFHRALINRGQIAPIPPKEAYPPGRSLQPVGSYASGLPSSMSDSSARRSDSVGFR